MKRILIVGASSCLGSNLSVHLRKRFNVIGTYFKHRPQLSGVHLTPLEIVPGRENSIDHIMKTTRPDTVIYCSAWRSMAQCDGDPVGAHHIHASAPDRFHQSLSKWGGRFIYLSSSKVFSGDRGNYQESDSPLPIDTYGKTKLKGEEVVSQFSDWVTLRMGTIYGLGCFGQDSLTLKLLEKLWSKEPLPLVSDEYRTFTAAEEIAWVIERLIDQSGPINQVFHLGNSEPETYFTFLKKLVRALDWQESRLVPLTAEEFFSRYHKDHSFERYPNLTLQSKKLEALLGYSFESTQKGLSRIATKLSQGLN